MVLREPAAFCSPKRLFTSIMRSRLIRPLLVFEFLIAIEVCLTFWSQVGGQYHLDLMFWPWKFGLTVAAAWLITAITAELFHGTPEKPHALSRRAIIYAALLFAVVITAGVVTYYYHMNEPADDENNADAPARVTSQLLPRYKAWGKLSSTRPGRPLPIPSACPQDS